MKIVALLNAGIFLGTNKLTEHNINNMILNVREQGAKEHNKEYVYSILKENILLLKLKPGEKISEVKIQKIFSLSRSPIREAIVRLVEESLIDVFPQRGTYISLLDQNFIEESIFLRLAIDKEIMRMACSKEEDTKALLKILKNILKEQEQIAKNYKDEDSVIEFLELNESFHRVIYEAFGKLKIWNNIRIFGNHYTRFHILESISKTNVDFALSQHIKAIEAIKNKDMNIAYDMTNNILNNYKEKIKVIYNMYPDYFKYKID